LNPQLLQVTVLPGFLRWIMLIAIVRMDIVSMMPRTVSNGGFWIFDNVSVEVVVS